MVQPTSSEPAKPPIRLSLGGLLLRLVGGIVLVVGVLALVSYLWHEELLRVSRWFVHHLGAPGIGVGFFIPDAFTVPLPQDAFLAFGLVGGLGFWSIAAWGTAGSIAGGSLGFLIGRAVQRTRWYRHRITRRKRDAEQLVRRYGVGALALGAITPLPYSIMCWTCGALGMPFLAFLAVSTLRVVRVTGYLWLISLGVVHVTG